MTVRIRPLDRADLPRVRELVHAHMDAFTRPQSFMEATLLDDPWARDPARALVGVDGDEIVGFIGAQERRMSFDGSPITGVNVSQFVVAPEHRTGGVAIRLLRELFGGGQDLTWAEGAPEAVTRMWRLLGGDVDHARNCDWMVVLRPGRWLRRVASVALVRGLPRDLLPVAAVPGHTLSPKAGRRLQRPSLNGVNAHDAPGGEIADALPALTKGVRVRVAYDEAHLDHMLRHWGTTAGDIVSRLVARGDRPIGWYVYAPLRGQAGRLVYLSAVEREAGTVLAEMFAHARGSGGIALGGRLEPHLAEPLRAWRPVLGFGSRPVFHTKDAELRAALASTASVLSELDSVDNGWL
jgi:hypothetical protein